MKVEDPGEEIRPEAPGSKNLGVWFPDPDGYRWELNVAAREALKRTGFLTADYADHADMRKSKGPIRRLFPSAKSA